MGQEVVRWAIGLAVAAIVAMQSFTLLTVLRTADRLDTVSSTVNRLEGRFDGMDTRLDDLKADVRAVNDRVFALYPSIVDDGRQDGVAGGG